MSLIEDMLTGSIGKVVAVGATAVALPRVFPQLAPPLRTALRSGLKLFIESESDAEGGIIDKLVDDTMQSVLASLSAPGSGGEQNKSAEAAVQHFQDRAHHRARRYARDDPDRHARYHRHVSRLKAALAKAQQGRSPEDQRALQQLAGQLDAA